MRETIAVPDRIDAEACETALDSTRSFLVRAPAGSGKTELLTRRFLKLLAEVEQPEEILAITFTRAATAEMRSRILDALAGAAAGNSDGKMDMLAAAALANAERRQWHLLEQPQRLNVQTIDSLSLSIASRTPILSRLSGGLSPITNPARLYQQAARNVLSQLGGDRLELSAAIRLLLAHRDSNLNDCEDLIAGMLGHRDQWGRIFGVTEDQDWEQIRSTLEAPFVRARTCLFERVRDLLTRETAVWDELLDLLAYACDNLSHDPEASLLCLRGLRSFEQLGQSDSRWRTLSDFLLTKQNGWRKAGGLKAAHGFPEGSQPFKNRFAAMIDTLDRKAGALDTIAAIRSIPSAGYSPGQWEMLQQILLLLRHAIAELRVIFAEENAVDFIEIGLAARQALRGAFEASESGYLHGWRHLLIDEFQDTSRAQYELFELLVKQWEQDEGPHSYFLVGDPMQSIYGFRESEVELFEMARSQGLAGRPLELLTLQTNFRSHAGLVDPLNRIFDRVLHDQPARDSGAVEFSPSVAAEPAPGLDQGLHIIPRFQVRGTDAFDFEQAEAADAVAMIRRATECATDPDTFRLAVLARSKKGLWRIAHELRAAGIPFHAVEMEDLTQRQEVLDLVSLTRALLHPMDRVAWLSVMRAPWCGLSLADLHTLSGVDEPELHGRPMLELLRMRLPLLTPDGRVRAEKTAVVLEMGIRGLAAHANPARWIEQVWRALGGAECVSAEEWENIRAFLLAIDDLPSSGAGLDERIGKLCAQPDPATTETHGIQLMSIHKAKGLGFDTVIVPGLHHGTAKDEQPLLLWFQRTISHGPQAGENEILVCPIGGKGEDTDPLYRWIQAQKDLREREEAKRLLYVASTRAGRELYLMGMATVHQGVPQAGGKSLLAIGWEGLAPYFIQSWNVVQASSPNGISDNAGATGGEGSISPRVSSPKLPLRRLPSSMMTLPGEGAGTPSLVPSSSEIRAFDRPHGGLESRATGTVIHALLEEIARLLGKSQGDDAAQGLIEELGSWQPRVIALLRHQGLKGPQAELHAAAVLASLRSALEDRHGLWILSAREDAEAEISWSHWENGLLSSLRGDRTFLAGPQPLSQGRTHRWIVDYKTANHAADGLERFLEEQRACYRPQLEQYADVFRSMGSDLPFRLALYYPRLKHLIWWEDQRNG